MYLPMHFPHYLPYLSKFVAAALVDIIHLVPLTHCLPVIRILWQRSLPAMSTNCVGGLDGCSRGVAWRPLEYMYIYLHHALIWSHDGNLYFIGGGTG